MRQEHWTGALFSLNTVLFSHANFEGAGGSEHMNKGRNRYLRINTWTQGDDMETTVYYFHFLGT